MNRNRFIIRALERSLAEENEWSQSFLEVLREAREDREGQRAIDELMTAVRERRTRKRAPEL